VKEKGRADSAPTGTNVVLLDPELAEAFPDSKSVNDALRALVAIAARAESHGNSRIRVNGTIWALSPL
jgi:hypothetical protein